MTIAEPLLDNDLIAFLGSGVTILLATRDQNNVPAMTRAYGCEIGCENSATDQSVTLIVCRQESRQVLNNLTQAKDIAAVFARPSTYEAFQVKGMNAAIAEGTNEYRDKVNHYFAALFTELDSIGVPESTQQGLAIARKTNEFVGLRFTPTDIFCQTPGPGAGERVTKQS